MIFATKGFFVFLPIVLLLYHLSGKRESKYRILLLASWIFYAWISPYYLWVIILCTMIDYFAALKIESARNDRLRRSWLTLSIAANLGLLFSFKYTAFVYDNAVLLGNLLGISGGERTWEILLPLGISFHTFQGISYTIDVYRKQITAVRRFSDYALFVSFFPQLAAGPIVRAVEFLPQMKSPPRVTAQQVADGLHYFVLGLFKKVFIADQLDQLLVGPIFADPGAFDPNMRRLACFAWAAQIYCDFSGYSDIAMGCAKWFGFELPHNFHLPYLATSITDFWRRWHMSLSTWLRDYLYFPLGGSRRGEFRTNLNLMIIFLICGLWHGATWSWLVYGLYNGILMCIHRAWCLTSANKPWLTTLRENWIWNLLARALTLLSITAGLILIRMPSWTSGEIMAISLFGLDSDWSGAALPSLWAFALLFVVAAGHLAGGLRESLNRMVPTTPAFVRAAGYATAVIMLVTLGPGVGKTFIYLAF